MSRDYWAWSYRVMSNGKKHKATQKQELLYNKCKSCDKVSKGVMKRWTTYGWIWRCPHCLNGQRYPR